VFFLSAAVGAFIFSLDQLRAVGPAHPLLRIRQIVLVVVIVAMPSLFDPSTVEINNLPRLVLIVVAAVLILAVWAVDAVWSGWRPSRLVNGLQWVLVALVLWVGVTTLTSVEPRQSLLGRYASYEGFILIAALAVLTCALAESFNSEALPALFRVVVASTVPILVYGGIQFYGYVLHKSAPVDFVNWHNAYHNVFATFGNPNHLGGFIATVVPLGIVTAVLAKNRWVRVALWGWVAIILVLLLQTAARGAWLGALAGGAVLVVGLFPRLRASARTVGIVGAGGLLVAAALVASGSHFIGAKASALLKVGAGSSVSQRYGYWSAALHLAAHHPIVGTGPDTFAITYARYQSATLAKTLGNAFFVNGAHNIFFSWLANEGVPGLILILALFGIAVVWGVRSWRLLRLNRTDDLAADDRDQAPGDTHWYLVVALVAAIVAYFVQASFDVEQVATLFTLFVVLGFLGVANRGVWPAVTLVRLPLGSGVKQQDPDAPTAEEDSEYPIRTVRKGVYGRSSSQARSDVRRLGTALAAGLVAFTVVGLTFWRMDAMWRADHDAWLGSQTSVVRAINLNPWEPSYFGILGRAAENTYSREPQATDALQVVQEGVGYLRQATNLDGYNSSYQAQLGALLQIEAKLEHSNKVLLRQALAAFRQAQEDNPRNTEVPPFIRQVEKSLSS
jgi:O-antigen ligase